MTVPSNPLIAVLARAHSDHQRRGRCDVRWSRDEIDWVHWWQCGCGFEVRTDEAPPLWFEEHVAAAQAAALIEAGLMERAAS